MLLPWFTFCYQMERRDYMYYCVSGIRLTVTAVMIAADIQQYLQIDIIQSTCLLMSLRPPAVSLAAVTLLMISYLPCLHTVTSLLQLLSSQSRDSSMITAENSGLHSFMRTRGLLIKQRTPPHSGLGVGIGGNSYHDGMFYVFPECQVSAQSL